MASVIISYCSNEQIFLDSLLKECLKFSDDIVISYGSHLYDGTPEDIKHINEYKDKYPTIQFIEYKVDIKLDLYKQKGVKKRPIAYWHNLARFNGKCHLKKKEWVFIIDSDEIPEGVEVKKWLTNFKLDKKNCYKIANYWYYKYPTNQAKTIEDSILLIHYDYLNEFTMYGDLERDYIISSSGCILDRRIMGLDNKPIWHHYSFVRTKDGLKHKMKNWGHKDDFYDVEKIIDYINKNDNDIIHNYEYIKVDNKFNILS